MELEDECSAIDNRLRTTDNGTLVCLSQLTVPLGSDIAYPRGAMHRTRGVRFNRKLHSFFFI